MRGWLFGLLALVDGEIIQDDDITGPEGGRELGVDIGLEDDPVHWGIDNPGSDEAIALEACYEGLRSGALSDRYAVLIGRLGQGHSSARAVAKLRGR